MTTNRNRVKFLFLMSFTSATLYLQHSIVSKVIENTDIFVRRDSTNQYSLTSLLYETREMNVVESDYHNKKRNQDLEASYDGAGAGEESNRIIREEQHEVEKLEANSLVLDRFKNDDDKHQHQWWKKLLFNDNTTIARDTLQKINEPMRTATLSVVDRKRHGNATVVTNNDESSMKIEKQLVLNMNHTKYLLWDEGEGMCALFNNMTMMTNILKEHNFSDANHRNALFKQPLINITMDCDRTVADEKIYTLGCLIVFQDPHLGGWPLNFRAK